MMSQRCTKSLLVHLHTDLLRKQYRIAVKLTFIDQPVDDVMKVHQKPCDESLGAPTGHVQG